MDIVNEYLFEEKPEYIVVRSLKLGHDLNGKDKTCTVVITYFDGDKLKFRVIFIFIYVNVEDE